MAYHNQDDMQDSDAWQDWVDFSQSESQDQRCGNMEEHNLVNNWAQKETPNNFVSEPVNLDTAEAPSIESPSSIWPFNIDYTRTLGNFELEPQPPCQTEDFTVPSGPTSESYSFPGLFDTVQQFSENPYTELLGTDFYTGGQNPQYMNSNLNGMYGVPNTALGLELGVHDTAATTSEMVASPNQMTTQPPSLEYAAENTSDSQEIQKRVTTKVIKKRFPCKEEGCKDTFAREYDVKRHMSSIHNRTNFYCLVYGCNRTTKPFARIDKLSEHCKKHINPDKFICLLDQCDLVPLSSTDLRDHLRNVYHGDSNSEMTFVNFQRSLDSFLTLEDIRVEALQTIAKARSEGKNSCPLEPYLGCNFQLSPHDLDMQRHIEKHELAERIRFSGEIEICLGHPETLDIGTVTCPVCNEKFEDKWFHYLGGFTSHVFNFHPRIQVHQHIEELLKLIGPSRERRLLDRAIVPYYLDKVYLELNEALLLKSLSESPHST